MNIRYIHILKIVLFCCIITVTGYDGRGQVSGNNRNNNIDKKYLEKLYVQTDRDIYISGEQIWLKIYKLNGSAGSPDNMSKVVYVELLDRQYNPVNQFKILLEAPSGAAVFRLSDTLSTGVYLVCAYTRWMLNFPGNRNAYKPVYIINPFKKIDYIFPANDFQRSNDAPASRQGKERSVEKKSAEDENNQIDIEISPLSYQYGEREEVKFDIYAKEIRGNPVNADMSVSIVRSSLVFDDGLIDFNGYLSDTIQTSFREIPENIPELEGEIIIGTLRDNITGDPLEKTGISLSFVGKNNRSQFAETDENGKFIFVVKNQFGKEEMVIQPVSREIQEAYVELEQPFSAVSDEFLFRFPGIDSSRLVSINKAIVSMQVNSIYEQTIEKPEIQIDNSINQDFYGKPLRRVYLSDFIELADIKEVIKEILPEVKVVRRNKEIGLKVMNDNPFEIFKNMSLVLVDGVPVYNIETLLNVSAREFERIDIINTRYFYRKSVFEGIVSFVTKKGNLSILGYENFFFRQVFEGFTKNQGFYSPDYSSDSLKTSTIPDFRNTIYWNPDIKSGQVGRAQIKFFTSDESGEYTIIVEGITSDGKYGIKRIPIKIR